MLQMPFLPRTLSTMSTEGKMQRGHREMLKPKHPCAQPGCRATCSGRFCPNHRRPTAPNSEINGWKWRKYSAAFLARNPHCADPFQRHRGTFVKSTVTGHRIAHKGNPGLFWSSANHYPLCASCNAFQCVRDEGGFGNEQRKPSERDSQSIRSTQENSKANEKRTIINNLQSGF